MSREAALAVNLAAARRHARLTQTQLAERIGVTHSTVSATEAGKHELGATKLIRWARACNVSLVALAEGVE